MTGRQWRRKLFRLFCAASLRQRHVVYLWSGCSGDCDVGVWDGVFAWWFDRPETLEWKLITSVFTIAGFAVFVAIYNLFWMNRAAVRAPSPKERQGSTRECESERRRNVRVLL